MTMFKELFALACSATFTMIVSADEKSGRMTVNVIPKPKADAGEPALAQPLSLTATPQEFDAGFIDALRGYREVRCSLAQQAEATQEVLQAAKAASAKKAGEAVAKAAKPATTASKTTPTPAPTQTADGDLDDEEGSGGSASQRPAATTTATGGESFDLFG